eukprot:CAMPEP_0168556240 /NCGR_PEP_ID=MMETSP0413-20121227/8772_1 /TAXON_ID=136452 /ORGANISM="Filamoeba nolandi, Strain NC-AS-23-1" /LENGTH=280 /DNA_ID=CAMNT_0008587163 /DNA_START=108 /DNA_END=950 /DNA_ORIENTATION=+
MSSKNKQSSTTNDVSWDPDFKRRVTFIAALYNVILVSVVLAKNPSNFYTLFSYQFPVIIALQCFIKHGEWKWSFFINDKSGVVNLLLFIYMHYFPMSCQAFRTVFAIMNGPVIINLVHKENALNLYDTQKTLNFFATLLPILTVWSIRWYNDVPSDFEEPFNTCSGDNQSSMSVVNKLSHIEAILIPLVLYMGWYFYFSLVRSRTLQEGKKVTPSMDNFQSILPLHLVMEMARVLLTLLPIKFFFYNFQFHTVYIFVLMSLSAWNGSVRTPVLSREWKQV